MLQVDLDRSLGGFELSVRFACGGGITALFGRSGAGKTTLVNLIAGLLRPRRGRIVIDGRVLFDSEGGIDLPPRRRRIGYVFQDARLFPHLTVRQNLRYGRWFTPPAERYADFGQVVKLLGLEALLDRRPGTLSGGEKQRVAIGRALLASPALLLMDEPLASLDAARKAEILPYIERLRDELAVPIIYVSHALDEVARLADNLVLLSEGRVAAVGPVAEVMSRLDLRPLTGRYEAGAVLETRIAAHDAAFELTRLAFAGGDLLVPHIELPAGTPVRVRIRSRDVAVSTEPPRGLSIRNMLRGRIVECSIEPGPFAELKLDVGGASLIARVTRHAVQELDLVAGQEVYALIKSVALDRHSLGHAATATTDASPSMADRIDL